MGLVTCTERVGDTGDGAVAVSANALSIATTVVAAGEKHTCAALETGELYCWGNNDNGRLGDGTAIERRGATRVTGIAEAVVSVGTGDSHTCAVDALGETWCWGLNGAGRVGDGTTTNRQVPTSVLLGATQVAAGGKHSCAVLTGGSGIKCWGGNDNGQIGNNTTQDQLSPVSVMSLGGTAAEVATGSNFTCARLSTGALRCWGSGNAGRLGNDSTSMSKVPVPVSGVTAATKVTAGGDHACAIVDGTGRVKCWGDNSFGQLGDGTSTQRKVPAQVLVDASAGGGDLVDAVDLRAGSKHTCAVKSSGQVLCWGKNDQGRLGDGTTTNRDKAVNSSVTDGVKVAAGTSHSCAVRATGEIACWGENGAGRVGDGTQDNRLTHSPLAGVCGVEQVAAGSAFSCGVLDDGTVSCWGENDRASLGNGSTVNRWAPWPASVVTGAARATTAGHRHACALTSEGNLYCWGKGDDGRVGYGGTTDQPTPVMVLAPKQAIRDWPDARQGRDASQAQLALGPSARRVVELS